MSPAYISYQPGVRRDYPCQPVYLSGVVHSHFQNSKALRATHLKESERHPDMIVETLRILVSPPGG
mgnify:CR=1 FL=1